MIENYNSDDAEIIDDDEVEDPKKVMRMRA